MTAGLLIAIAIAIAGTAAPHHMRLDRARPSAAAAVWAAALALRAVLTLWAAATLLLVVPSTALFRTLTHWCQHLAVPEAGVHFDLYGHDVGAIAIVAPAIVLSASVFGALWHAARTARRIRRDICNTALGEGPEHTVMVGGSDVLFAAVGLMRPRIVVSTGALAKLDDAELAAGLAHEEGHVRRRHHQLLLYGELCRALGCWIPGTKRAVAELRFHLERDADAWALRSHDPLALASVICKAASPADPASPAIALLSGSAVLRRVDLLLDAGSAGVRARRRRVLDLAAAVMACLVLASLIAIPAQAVSVEGPGVPDHTTHHCGN